MSDDEQIRLLTEIRDSLREIRSVFRHPRPSGLSRWVPVLVGILVIVVFPALMMWLAYGFAWNLVEHSRQLPQSQAEHSTP